MIDLSRMTTEKVNPNTTEFSSMSIRQAIEVMNNENYHSVRCIEEQFDTLEKVITITSEVLEQGGRIIYMGAGTSGRIGLLDAVECPPTFGVDYNTVVGLIAGGDNAFVKAVEGTEDSKVFGVNDLKKIGLNRKDIVIGLAASGRTPYVIGGIEYAKEVGAKYCAVVHNKNSEIKKICPLTIEAEPGAEVLTGSTRLKSGTTTKLILNMISTISMIRIGKVYKNYMVDVKMSNEKLITRGTNIVSDVTGCSKEIAKEVLIKSNGGVRTAIVMILLDCTKEEAESALKRVNGRIDNLVKERE